MKKLQRAPSLDTGMKTLPSYILLHFYLQKPAFSQWYALNLSLSTANFNLVVFGLLNISTGRGGKAWPTLAQGCTDRGGGAGVAAPALAPVETLEEPKEEKHLHQLSVGIAHWIYWI